MEIYILKTKGQKEQAYWTPTGRGKGGVMWMRWKEASWGKYSRFGAGRGCVHVLGQTFPTRLSKYMQQSPHLANRALA